jgi:hypothetical protein
MVKSHNKMIVMPLHATHEKISAGAAHCEQGVNKELVVLDRKSMINCFNLHILAC